MSEQTWSPDPAASVVEHRPGWWAFIGGLAMFVFFGLAAIFPEAGNPSATSKDVPPALASLLFGALALGGVLVMVGFFPRTHNFAVDERGLWWRAGRKSDLIAWEELHAVRGQEPRPPVQGDPNSKVLLSALVLTPVDRRFVTRHRELLKRPPTADPEVELRLPNAAAVRQLTQEVARVRPDLLG